MIYENIKTEFPKTHKKYFVMPLESDDYDTPLLDNSIPTTINKYDDHFILYDTFL